FEYGSQLILAAADAIGGLPAIVVLAALMISTAYTLLLVFLLRKGVDPLLAVAALVSSIFVGMMDWLARPHLVTTLATVVLLSLIAAPRRISPAWFIPLFAIWANLHGGFLYGLAVIGLFVAGSALTAGALQPSMRGPALRELRYYMVSLAAALGGTLLTP